VSIFTIADGKYDWKGEYVHWSRKEYQQRKKGGKVAGSHQDRLYTLATTLVPANTILAARIVQAPLKAMIPPKICRPVYSPSQCATSAPPIGLLHSAANEMIANTVPFLTPISLTSEIWATKDGASETNDPLPKPYRAAKTMIGALEAAGIQRARTRMPVNDIMIVMTLYLPILSAATPGSTRPKKDAPLRIGIRYSASLDDIPKVSACKIK